MTHRFFAQDGFTIIELLITLTVMSVISTIGLVSFVQYGRSQALNAATQDVVSLLHQAKSSASSQVKPGTCTRPLDGYRITINYDNQDQGKVYRLDTICTEAFKIKEKTLPTNIFFSTSSSQSFLFRVLKGTVEGADAINGTSFTLYHSQDSTNLRKTITIYADGRIKVQ